MKNNIFLTGVFLLVAMVGCHNPIYRYSIKNGDKNEASGKLLFGVSNVDITPYPGFPMGGFGSEGQIARGVWTSLYSKANYFEDPDGNRFVLVSCDLWSIPYGLVNEVVKTLNESTNKDHHLGTDQVYLCATHTHHSQAGYSSSMAYNALSSAKPGFHEKLYHWMGERISQSIQDAIDTKKEVKMAVSRSSIEGLVRNRSYEAFQKINQEDQDAITKEVRLGDEYFQDEDLPHFINVKEEFEAVDPYVTTINIYQRGNTVAQPIAMINFLALHPTVMGMDNPFYSSDILGVAGQYIKNQMGWNQTIVSFINGAEGDISANWKKQDFENTISIGEAIGNKIISGLNNAQSIDYNIETHYDIVNISAREVSIMPSGTLPACMNHLPHTTAKNPFPGIATIGGAEDGRTTAFYHGLSEGTKKDTCIEGHGNKIIGLEPAIKELAPGLPATFLHLTRKMAADVIKKTAPRKLPLGVIHFGQYAICFLPGEFTTPLGYYIKNAIAKNYQFEDYQNVLIAGLSNEYMSYFTTPEEYFSQQYEGSSTMYGYMSGSFIQQELMRISNIKNVLNEEFRFEPGFISLGDVLNSLNKEVNIDTVFDLLMTGNEFNPILKYTSTHEIPNFNKDHYYPHISIQKKQSDNSFIQISKKAFDYRIIKAITQIKDKNPEWAIMWIPEMIVPGTFRFQIVEGLSVLYSKEFMLQDISSKNYIIGLVN